MQECLFDCPIASIPARLHSATKQDGKVSARAIVPQIDDADCLFMRHPPLPDGQGYGFNGVKIPSHDHLADQSVNSKLLNVPDGHPCDVLFNTKDGNHYSAFQIACFVVSEIRDIKIGNPNTIQKDRLGNTIKSADVYTFDVKHQPTPCMYPHCIVQAMKNNNQIENKQIRDVMKTLIRSRFAELAERRRLEMDVLMKSSSERIPVAS